jgi:hypothetical protein
MCLFEPLGINIKIKLKKKSMLTYGKINLIQNNGPLSDSWENGNDTSGFHKMQGISGLPD